MPVEGRQAWRGDIKTRGDEHEVNISFRIREGATAWPRNLGELPIPLRATEYGLPPRTGKRV